MPKVSVVITAYNSMNYLPETLDSVLQQNFTDFEVLIIDDGSSDNIEQWVAQITDKRIRFISQKNQGVSVARNTGITNAEGEYVAFLDGDDIWLPTKLEKQVNYLEKHPEAGLVHTWLAFIDQNSKPTGKILCSHSQGNVWQEILQRNMVACSSSIVRRSCFDTVGLFDYNLRVSEDWDMWIRIAKKYQFAVIKEPLVKYRQHPQSKSKRYASQIQDFQIIVEKAFNSAPFELLHLRNRSYGYINLCIAWKCLQGSEADCKSAKHFRHLALEHCPKLFFSWEYIRLSVAIELMSWLGVSNYKQLLESASSLRILMSNINIVFTKEKINNQQPNVN